MLPGGRFAVRVLTALVVVAGAVTGLVTPARALSLLPSTIAITGAAPATVYVGDAVTLSGTVTTTAGLLGRKVDLQRDTGSGFTAIDSITTSGDGWWVFTLPTAATGVATYRVFSGGNLVLADATSAPFTVAVQTRPATPRLPVATPTTWQPLGPDNSSWSSCAPITYRINAGSLRRYGRRLAQRGIAQVQRATGFQFRYLGTTKAVPYTSRAASGAMLTIAFASRKALGDAPADAGGRAGYSSRGSTIVSGEAVLDAGLIRVARRVRGQIPLKLVLHELGHTMGLGHVITPENRMFPVISVAGVPRYGPGDLLGLQAHGTEAAAPCASRTTVLPLHHVDTGWD